MDSSPEQGSNDSLENTAEDAEAEGSGTSSDVSNNAMNQSKRGRGRTPGSNSSPITPISDPQVGDIVWAKVKNSRCWPGALVNKDDCGKLVSLIGGRETNFYVYWYGDGRVSAVGRSKLFGFQEGFQQFSNPPGRKLFQNAIYIAITEFRKLQALEMDDWNVTKAFAWAKDGFPYLTDIVKKPGTISQHVQDKLQTLRDRCENMDDDSDDVNVEGRQNSDDSSPKIVYSKEKLDLFRSIRDDTTSINEICLSCATKVDGLSEHPLFQGSICEPCKQKLLELSFSTGLDKVAFYCCVCMCPGDLIMCSHPQCYRAYCHKCCGLKAALGAIDNIRKCDPWSCFLCEPYTPEMHGYLQPRAATWKRNMWELFHSDIPKIDALKDMPLRVMCCDGSCDAAFGVLSSLNSLDVKLECVFLCNFNMDELDRLKQVLPENVIQLKSVGKYQDADALSEFAPIHIVIGSSEEKEEKSLGKRFMLFHSILLMLGVLNSFAMQPAVPMMWIFEATPPFWHHFNTLITRYLEFDPAEWSDSDSRFPNQPKTLVWTNIPLLWPMLQGAGATPTACNKNRGQYKTDAETGFEQKPTQLWKENEKRDLNSRRWKKRKLILTECPRVTRSMSTSCSK